MAEYPAIPFWTDRYFADTRHLTTLEHGAYLLLLFEAWRRPHCSLPDNDDLLARLVGLPLDDWLAIRPTVMAFWRLDKRKREWTQKTLLKERAFVAQKSEVQRDNALRRWNKKKRKDATAMPNACQPDAPTPTPTPTDNNPPVNPPGTRARGSRLPEDWTLPKDWAEEVRLVAPSIDVGREAEKFRDYYVSVSGAKATKMNWRAAFRNWCRKAEEDTRFRPKSNGHNPAAGIAGYRDPVDDNEREQYRLYLIDRGGSPHHVPDQIPNWWKPRPN